MTDTNHAGESVKRMLTRKKLSNLINLDVLDELEKRSGAGVEAVYDAVAAADLKPAVVAGEENDVEVVGSRKKVVKERKTAVKNPLGVVNAPRGKTVDEKTEDEMYDAEFDEVFKFNANLLQ